MSRTDAPTIQEIEAAHAAAFELLELASAAELWLSTCKHRPTLYASCPWAPCADLGDFALRLVAAMMRPDDPLLRVFGAAEALRAHGQRQAITAQRLTLTLAGHSALVKGSVPLPPVAE